MATVDEDNTITIYDEIGAQEEVGYGLEYDNKHDDTTNEPIETTDHTKKNSSLIELDFTVKKKNFKPEKDRKSSLQSTESVEVRIYHRTSLVTSSGGVSPMKISTGDINSNHHQRADTGINIWDNSPTKITNYELQDMDANDVIFHDKYDNNNDINYSSEASTDIMNDNSDILTKDEEITITKISQMADQNKSRHSLSVDAEYNNNNNLNTTIITHKSSTISATTSVVYHGSDSENINVNSEIQTRPTRSTSIIYYGSEDENKNQLIKESEINESRNSMKYKSKPVRSTSIIYYGSEDENKNGLITESEINESRNSMKYKSKSKPKYNNNNVSGNLKINAKNENNNKHINKSSMLEMIGTPIIKPKLPNQRMQNVNELDEQFYKEINKDKLSHKSNLTENSLLAFNTKDKIPEILTTDNLMKHDYENKLNDITYDSINVTYSQETNRKRYIPIRDKYKLKKKKMQIQMQPINENEILNDKNKLSHKIKYITAIGAVCAVTVLVGVVLYSKGNNNNVSVIDAADILTPRRRRGPPRIG